MYRHAGACRWGDHKAGGRCWLHLEINRIIHVLGTIIRKKGVVSQEPLGNRFASSSQKRF